ncbi:molybdopterin-binding protein [Desulfosporosinus sp. FKA]|uniref:molybdopterin-binding protein n=1 Tax=Desulfosporosinus sp. FKA TaxID=1969834 RepID=UPI000B498AA7|nr:molybdopterin-binding protein [Desulfosporosinus sp. FKA]
MKMIHVSEAVGSALCHDLTKIVPGKFKGAAFKKGHIIRPEDVEVLLSMGKEHIYVWEITKGTIHENEAALRLASAACGGNLTLTEPSEGKVNLISKERGLLKINMDLLYSLNSIDQIIFASRHNNTLVNEGDVVAGTRVVPLVIEEDKIIEAEAVLHQDILVTILPLQSFKVGLITTGNEVFYKRIEDKFGPVVTKKLEALGSSVLEQVFVPDDSEKISDTIKSLISKGAEAIVVTGGMSVDPDDVTPYGIRQTGAEIVTYGLPVLPGAMFLLAYYGDIPIMGLPGCVMYSKASILDLVLPRILCGERLVRQNLVELSHGGLCLQCPECKYPICPFGKA